jgi:hypothetical protein
MQVTFVAQFLLSQFQLDATFPNSVAEGTEKMAVLKVHAGQQWCRLA